MTQKDVDKILQTYMPEKLWVSRVGNMVYSMECKPFVFKGAKAIKFRKVSMWRWFGFRTAVGMWIERIGKRIAYGTMKRKENADADS